METLEKNLPVLVINGATLLIVVVLLIRMIAKVVERFSADVSTGMVGLKDELVALRRDIRDVGNQTALAVSGLTERVSRIEGKIEGIIMSRAPELADDDERTPVEVPIPEPATRARTGPVERVTPEGAYHLAKPRNK